MMIFQVPSWSKYTFISFTRVVFFFPLYSYVTLIKCFSYFIKEMKEIKFKPAFQLSFDCQQDDGFRSVLV